MNHSFRKTYLKHLSKMTRLGSTIGFVVGMIIGTKDAQYKYASPQKSYIIINVIRYTAYGTMIGALYPISYPTIFGYMFYKYTQRGESYKKGFD
jgi:hypothetical protein